MNATIHEKMFISVDSNSLWTNVMETAEPMNDWYAREILDNILVRFLVMCIESYSPYKEVQ